MNETLKKEDKPTLSRRTRDERKLLERLKRRTGFYKKKSAKQEKMLPALKKTAHDNMERLTNEAKFARNVRVASKHDRRVRWRSRWRLYTFIITGALLIARSAYLLYSFVFVITDIEVEGGEIYTEEEIVSSSGITLGTKLFSPWLDLDAAKTSIFESCPYIGEVTFEKSIPGTLKITVTESEALFVSEVYGEYALLSEDLHVLDIRKDCPDGYIKLILPDVKSAIEGYEIEFVDDIFEVVSKIAAAASDESICDMITKIDASDRFNISIIYDGRYNLLVGSVTDIELKLRIALEMMEDDVFTDDSRGTIYLDDVNKPSIVIDNTLTFD